jgi:hypothetical protein
VRRSGVRRITDQDHPTLIPRLKLDPFNRPNMKLFVILQGREIRRHWPAKRGKPAAEAPEASLEWVRKALRVDRSEPIRRAPTHWDEPENASLAHQHHHLN